jgi:hypothetical protein
MANLFPISLEVEEVAVGRVLRKLTGMSGVARIHLSLQNAKQLKAPQEEEPESIPFLQPMLRDPRGNKHLDPIKNPRYRAMAELLLKTPAHINILAKAIERVGYKSGGTSVMIFRMQKLGFVRRTAPGTYALTPKGVKSYSNQQVELSLVNHSNEGMNVNG